MFAIPGGASSLHSLAGEFYWEEQSSLSLSLPSLTSMSNELAAAEMVVEANNKKRSKAKKSARPTVAPTKAPTSAPPSVPPLSAPYSAPTLATSSAPSSTPTSASVSPSVAQTSIGSGCFDLSAVCCNVGECRMHCFLLVSPSHARQTEYDHHHHPLSFFFVVS